MAKLTAEQIAKVKGMGFLENRGTEDEFSARIITGNGNITAEQMQKVVDFANEFGSGSVSMTTRLTLEIPGVKFDRIPETAAFFEGTGLSIGGTGPKVRPVVSCKGTVCRFGNTDTLDLAEKIHETFYHGFSKVKLPHKFKIAVGGCPNNCAKPNLNDIGIVSLNTPNCNPDACENCATCGVVTACYKNAIEIVDGKFTFDAEKCNGCGRCRNKCNFDVLTSFDNTFRFYLGGRWGNVMQHGEPLSYEFKSHEDALVGIEMLILLFREAGVPGERFGAMLTRKGIDYFNAEIASRDVLNRKPTILSDNPELANNTAVTC